MRPYIYDELLVVNDPVVYLHAGLKETLTLDANDKVEEIKNLGSGPDFECSTAAKRPQWRATDDLVPDNVQNTETSVIQFEVSDQFLASKTALSAGQDITIFSVYQIPQNPGTGNWRYGTHPTTGWAVQRLAGKFLATWNLMVNGIRLTPNLGAVFLTTKIDAVRIRQTAGFDLYVAGKNFSNTIDQPTATQASPDFTDGQKLYIGAHDPTTTPGIRHSLLTFMKHILVLK